MISPQQQVMMSGSGEVCQRCLKRVKEMQESESKKCQAGADKVMENWNRSGLLCFGLCEAEEVCAEHGWPLHLCRDVGHHDIYAHRGTWHRQRSLQQHYHHYQQQQQQQQQSPLEHVVKPKIEEDDDDDLSNGSNYDNSSCTSTNDGTGTGYEDNEKDERVTPSGAAQCDCVERLERLTLCPWVSGNSEMRSKVEERLFAARGQGCQGFCRTPYCCKVHVSPAEVRAGSGATRYHCLGGPHSSTANKGRHHIEYCYYCAAPDCCGGKWYSRDETHKRRIRRATEKLKHEHAPQQSFPSSSSSPLSSFSSSSSSAVLTSGNVQLFVGYENAKTRKLHKEEKDSDNDKEEKKEEETNNETTSLKKHARRRRKGRRGKGLAIDNGKRLAEFLKGFAYHNRTFMIVATTVLVLLCTLSFCVGWVGRARNIVEEPNIIFCWAMNNSTSSEPNATGCSTCAIDAESTLSCSGGTLNSPVSLTATFIPGRVPSVKYLKGGLPFSRSPSVVQGLYLPLSLESPGVWTGMLVPHNYYSF